MSNLIVGYEWSDIQAMQQRAYRAPSVDLSKPSATSANTDDNALLAKHGSIEALESAGLYGVADRLKRSAIHPSPASPEWETATPGCDGPDY